MMRKTPKKVVIIGLLAASTLLLSGCGASGNNAATSHIKQVTDGVEGNSGLIAARDFLLVAQPDGSAALVGTLVNDGTTPDYLTGISVNGITAKLSAPKFELAQNAPVIFAGDSANAEGTVPGLNEKTGVRVPATISFATGDAINLNLLVLPKSGFYANVGASSSVAVPAKTVETTTASSH
jgi:hypothetical protein